MAGVSELMYAEEGRYCSFSERVPQLSNWKKTKKQTRLANFTRLRGSSLALTGWDLECDQKNVENYWS